MVGINALIKIAVFNSHLLERMHAKKYTKDFIYISK